MLINEVCKECSLTKKAIEYYIEQELIFPAIQENGYRSFSEEDVLILKKISVLRNLGLSVTDIRAVLSDETEAAMHEICNRKTLQISILQEKQKLMQELVEKQDWEEAESRLRQLQKKQTVLERFMDSFPGNYGKFICLHFAPYLNEPVITDTQQEAFDTIISFLDGACFDISDDLKAFFDEMTLDIDWIHIENISKDMRDAVREPEKFITEHQEVIENYIAYKQSEECKATPVYRLEEELRSFNSMSGYNDVFIPAMCRLSESYRKYQEELQKADEMFMQKYPEYGYHS